MIYYDFNVTHPQLINMLQQICGQLNGNMIADPTTCTIELNKSLREFNIILPDNSEQKQSVELIPIELKSSKLLRPEDLTEDIII